jgi:hypothetical protein
VSTILLLIFVPLMLVAIALAFGPVGIAFDIFALLLAFTGRPA